MHLRYYLDEHGKRIYTLKVRACANPPLPRAVCFSCFLVMVSEAPWSLWFAFYKLIRLAEVQP